MKRCMPLVAIILATATFPVLAQQPTSPDQPGNPAPGSSAGQPTTQQNPPVAESPAQNSSAPSAETSAAPMSPINGELVSKLDSKTAKPGDNVVVQTRASVKTDNGTNVPEGSKLVGHVLAVQPSGQGANSQLVLQFDHVELKGGQSLPVHSQIESIGTASAAGQTAGSPEAMSAPPAGSADRSPQSSSTPSSSAANGSTPNTAGSSSATGANSTAPAAGNAPAPGTVVAKNGNIAIQTTSIPGVLLANNAPGQSDPRMAKASSILLGVKKDIELDSGTPVVVDVSAASTGTH